MASHPFHRPAASYQALWLLTGFVAGALAVLIFHQGALAALHAVGISPRGAWSMQRVGPWHVPAVWSLAFWGGLWGVILAAFAQGRRGARLIAFATIFGAIVPTLVAWFVVAPIKHQPVAGGWAANAMLTAVVINALWGLGTGLGLALLRPSGWRGWRFR